MTVIKFVDRPSRLSDDVSFSEELNTALSKCIDCLEELEYDTQIHPATMKTIIRRYMAVDSLPNVIDRLQRIQTVLNMSIEESPELKRFLMKEISKMRKFQGALYRVED